MPDELTLTPEDYAVFSRVPVEWMDENYIGAEIAQVIGARSGVVMRRIERFVAVGLVERRGGRTLTAKTEVRRVGK